MFFFGWFEAVRGRLIGPKTWDQNYGIVLEFLDSREPPETVVGCCVCEKLCLGIYKIGNW